MVALLIIDIGLAAAGGVLLSKGLAEREAKPAPVEKKSEAATASVDKVATSVPAPAPAVVSPAAATPIAAAASNIAARESPKRDAAKPSPATTPATKATAATKPATSATKPATPATMPTTTKPDDKPTPEPAKPVTSVPAQPSAPDPDDEIDAAAARSKAAFAGCAADHPGHGAINIAFQVSTDGRVINAAAVENTTGNADLARCLIAEVSKWRVSAHTGAPVSLVRLFTYP
jgi:hypothetical protein